jgi:hypothetical protein
MLILFLLFSGSCVLQSRFRFDNSLLSASRATSLSVAASLASFSGSSPSMSAYNSGNRCRSFSGSTPATLRAVYETQTHAPRQSKTLALDNGFAAPNMDSVSMRSQVVTRPWIASGYRGQTGHRLAPLAGCPQRNSKPTNYLFAQNRTDAPLISTRPSCRVESFAKLRRQTIGGSSTRQNFCGSVRNFADAGQTNSNDGDPARP